MTKKSAESTEISEKPEGRKEPFRFALVGSPNSGKSTLFNALTGLDAKVANYPGVTVEHLEGTLLLPNKECMHLVDLPGTYSIDALSPEEQVTVDVLEGKLGEVSPRPDGIIYVADATSLPRTLSQLGAILARMEQPVILVLTMIDELKARGGSLRPTLLMEELGIPVIGIVGNKGMGIDDLKALIANEEKWKRRSPKQPPPLDVDERFKWADAILEKTYTPPQKGTVLTDAIDRVLLHPVAGLLIFIFIMVFFFQAIFKWASPLQGIIESGLSYLGSWLLLLPDTWFRHLLIDGIIAGVGSVIVFVPQIALLFLMLSLMEQSGYMSRAVFLIDRIMGWIGLDGRSFVSMLSSYACAVPGIMAARSIPDPRNRLVTILVAPFMPCSARLPVYTLLIAAFIPATTIWIFNLQGLVMFGLYILGATTALTAATILRKGLLRGRTLPFYIELPPYRIPTLKVLGRSIWNPVSSYLRKAGTLILVASIVLWTLLNFPSPKIPQSIAKRGPEAVQAYKIEHSAAATFGRLLEPAIAPIGFDWRLGVGLVSSIAAREVLVSTMAQTYGAKIDEDNHNALTRLLPHQFRIPGQKKATPLGSLAVALSLLIFFVFALQCFPTLSVMQRETGSWKWPALAFTVGLVLAYSFSFLTFNATLWIGKAFF